ncbi:MAG: 16S rRNA (uracil(1498)-N(3))-methyltransferase [Clostridia bacterium]|jgi:16S rRNA (uracil1498-N3)-methyltransferase|nr:16S rRNA (uracil(1498)-N(3))-methyltransferase [Lachnospiraceae bacterium]NCC00155.1 16S rRNA (uracil(1498)-N(3))-methyltransferase [Clostridia bacterium]NCD01583.1 16S rRNA (uracil(1498)-N(3))-methyltransferase [Clostridia bacterium]
MPRFFVPLSQVREEELVIRGNDVNHIKNVLRMHPGDEVSISDGQGMDYFCRIKTIEREEICLSIENSWKSYVELPVRLYLFQGLPKGDKMELIIQKAVELGAYEIIPVRTSRVIVKLDEKKEVKKLTRWQQIAEGGAKQSGRGIVPEIKPVMGFAQALAYARSLDGMIIPYEKAEGMANTRKIISGLKDKKSIGIFIGPEGGFDEKEVEAAIEAGASPVTLGRRILRTETAGLAMLSVLMFEFEEE